jgi:hypothetical protein
MRLAPILLCAAVSACASQTQMTWVRPDGKPVAEKQLEIDRTTCRGEMQKANLASTTEPAIARARPVDAVFVGCMAQRGYMQQAVE